MTKVTEKDFDEVINKKEISDINFFWIDFSSYDFSMKNFTSCKFEKCNLSNIKVRETVFNNVEFIKTKIMWVSFLEINKFLSNFNFIHCNIELSYFNSMTLKWISFQDSEIIECDFTRTNLEWADFSFCNLERTLFFATKLKKTNFTWATNFAINPSTNSLEKTKFSKENVIKLLDYFDIIVE